MIDNIEKWLELVEKRVREQLRKDGNPLADDKTWHLAINPATLCVLCGRTLYLGSFAKCPNTNRSAHTGCMDARGIKWA